MHCHRAEYQLTAVVALVQEELNSSPQEQGKAPQEAEGHLVAHVQVFFPAAKEPRTRY